MIDWQEFHFLRPLWFWALIPIGLLLWLNAKQRGSDKKWRSVIDKQLAKHVLRTPDSQSRWLSLVLAFIAALLCVIALAGPVWTKTEQPVFRKSSSLVILLDLSRSMDASDLVPSRIERARLKLIDLLRLRKEGDTALIVFAATPYVVSPLTSDNNTIINQLPSMTTDIMPAPGSRPDRAIIKGIELLDQAAIVQGDILLVGDSVNVETIDATRHLWDKGHRLHVLSVGTEQGGPIPLPQGGFVKDTDGAIVISKLTTDQMQLIATIGKGLYRSLSVDDSDILPLLKRIDKSATPDLRDDEEQKQLSDQWKEQGWVLLLPIVLLSAFAFRRGYLVVVFFSLSTTWPEAGFAFDWRSLWQRDDQRGYELLKNDPQAAIGYLDKNTKLKATAYYQLDDYNKPLELLKDQDDALANYIRGNTYAKSNQLDKAVNAYTRALEKQPDFTEAKENRDIVKKLIEQQKKQENQENSQQQHSDQNNQNEDSQSQQDDQPNQNTPSEEQDTKNNDEQQSQQDSKDSANQQQAQMKSQKEQGQESEQQSPDQHQEQNNDKQQTQSGQQDEDRQQQASVNEQEREQGLEENEQKEQHQGIIYPQQDPDQMSARIKEQQQATERWLRSIPDDPGGLWKRKFYYQYRREQPPSRETDPW